MRTISLFDTPEEKLLLAESRPHEAELLQKFKTEIAVSNLTKALRFWIWVSLLVESVRCMDSFLNSSETDTLATQGWLFFCTNYLVFFLTAICLVFAVCVRRHAEKYARWILFAGDFYMLIYMLRNVLLTVSDLESGFVGFDLIVALLLSGYTLYYRPIISLSNTILTITAFGIAVLYLRVNPQLNTFALFHIALLAILSCLMSIRRYHSKYKAFLKERSILEKNQKLDALNQQLEENRRKIETQNLQLQHLSKTDMLTGLGNRYSFVQQSTQALRDALQKQTFLSVAIVDVDNFKEINDTFGHTIGDACLKAIGQTFADAENDHIFAFRFGGDELVVLFTETGRSDAFLVMNRLSKATSNLKVPGLGKAVTLSVGIYSVIPQENTTLDMLIEKADQYLYAAKASGKNRIVMADPKSNS